MSANNQSILKRLAIAKAAKAKAAQSPVMPAMPGMQDTQPFPMTKKKKGC